MEDIIPRGRYTIKVPLFEGPLDLLLHLIRENKMDIYDIPIAQITHQYLDYIGLMQELNLDVASEFIVMAATLIYIKSRMLLPIETDQQATDEEDPRTDLVQKLLEYQSIKEASAQLRDKEALWADIFHRPLMEKSELPPEPELSLFDLNLFDLLGALGRILKEQKEESFSISRETLTVKDRITAILDRLEAEKSLRFDDLFRDDRTRVHVIVTFLALLEVLRIGLVRAYQEGPFGTIWIMKRIVENE